MREPKSLGEARRRKVRLELELEEINLQLNDRDRRESNGERIHPLKYMEWRKATKYASIEKKKELSELKFWIEDHWKSKGEAGEVEAIETIEALLSIISALADECETGLTKTESLLVKKAHRIVSGLEVRIKGDNDGPAR